MSDENIFPTPSGHKPHPKLDRLVEPDPEPRYTPETTPPKMRENIRQQVDEGLYSSMDEAYQHINGVEPDSTVPTKVVDQFPED